MARSPSGHIETIGRRIVVSSSLGFAEFRRLLVTMHRLRTDEGVQEIILDFRKCVRVASGAMAGLCAAAARLRANDQETALLLPDDIRLKNLFLNIGWAYQIDPVSHEPSHFRGYRHIPCVQFASPSEQKDLVDQMADAILKSMPGLQRADFAALEWALNEITDNVLVHARSQTGGIVHLTNDTRHKRVEFVVADSGLSIPRTLREGHSDLDSDARALERAVREGVTRSKSVGQGNGLYGTFRIVEASGGLFHIDSGSAHLHFDGSELRIRSDAIPYQGTIVTAVLNCSEPATLGEALRFAGSKAEPFDYIDAHYENNNDERVVFQLANEASSFGSRVAGAPVRTKLQNLLTMSRGQTVIIDLADVPLVSSSFADEVFGKLFVELGPTRFIRGITMINVSHTVQALVDRAIVQRAAQSTEKR